MAFSLLTSPLQMIFSLLLMQGISLTMFRAFLNQAINRADPLKFSLNFGNTSPNTSTPSLTPGVPTPAPIVDPRVMDLLTLIKALSPPQAGTAGGGQASTPLPVQVAAPLIALAPSQQQLQPLSLPLIQQAAASSSVATPLPQIIIIPQLKTSPSEQVSVKVDPPVESSTEDGSSREQTDSNTEDLLATRSDEENEVLRKWLSPSKRRQTQVPVQTNTKQPGVVIFEAVGVNFRHPNHNYGDSPEKSGDRVVEIDATHS